LLLSTWLAVVMLEVFKKTGWVLNNYSQFCFCKNLPKHGRHGQPFFGLVNRFCNYKRHHIFRKGLCGYHAEIIFSQNNLAFRLSCFTCKKTFPKISFSQQALFTSEIFMVRSPCGLMWTWVYSGTLVSFHRKCWQGGLALIPIWPLALI
jgi:hypothetical protein